MLSNINNKAIEYFQINGFYLLEGAFQREKAEGTAHWLKSQDLEVLAKTWTEQEPLVPLAVYTNVHQNDSPIAKIASDPELLKIATRFMGDEVYIWSSKVNLKAAWCGTADYFHQDFVYWTERGYKKMDLMSCMIFLEPHGILNGGLRVFPGSHREGFLDHAPFIDINGLSKFMVPPRTLNRLQKTYGYKIIEAQPGDVLFFHAGLVHGSSHNMDHQSRMGILSQLNTRKNIPVDVKYNAKQFNLKRAKMEFIESERRLIWFKQKYESQLNSEDIEFNSPIPKEEL